MNYTNDPDVRAIEAVDKALQELYRKRQEREIGAKEFAAGAALILPAKLSAMERLGRNDEAAMLREWLEDLTLNIAAEQDRKWTS